MTFVKVRDSILRALGSMFSGLGKKNLQCQYVQNVNEYIAQLLFVFEEILLLQF